MINIENVMGDMKHQHRMFMAWGEKAMAESDMLKKARYADMAKAHMTQYETLKGQLMAAGLTYDQIVEATK